MSPDALPFALIALVVLLAILGACSVEEWIESGRPSRLLTRYRAWFDRVVPVEEYPGQYDAALAPELIAKRDRTWAEADEFWDDDKFWASIADAIHELERKGDVA